MRCPGSVALSYGVADTSSVYADEGTAGHTVAATCLKDGTDAERFVGQTIHVYEDDGKTVRRSFIIEPDFADAIQVYVDAIRRTVGTKLYEQRVDYSDFIGVPGSTGTGDAVILDAEALTLESHDLKLGKGVKVSAKWTDDEGVDHPNEQLALYLAGALSDNDLIADWKRFKLAVHQPRIGADGHVDEMELTREQLMAFLQSARAAAAESMSGFAYGGAAKNNDMLVPLPVAVLVERGLLRPGEKQCRFCPAAEAGLCPKLEREVKRIAARAATDADFGPPVEPETTHVDELPSSSELELLELWIKGMRSRIQRELQLGHKLKHWKLVAGKRGARAWVKEQLAEATKALKKLLGKDAYHEPELLSPTQAENALKKLKNKDGYAKLAQFVTQAEGGEHVAPIDDDRPGIEKPNVELLLDADGDLI